MIVAVNQAPISLNEFINWYPEDSEIKYELGIGGRRYIGSPKQPTLSVCTLVEGEYEIEQFRGNDLIQSRIFPKLQLSVDQLFNP